MTDGLTRLLKDRMREHRRRPSRAPGILWASMTRRRQQPLAEMAREVWLKERRERKQAKRHAATAECKAQADESTRVLLEDSESEPDES